MSVAIIDKDLGYQRFVLDMKELRGRSVKVGIWDEGSSGGTSVLDYAIYNEFGTSRIPARPFMATTYDNNYDKTIKFVEFLSGKIIDGKITPDHALKVLGEEYQKYIQKTIRDAKSWAEPNAESTVAAKGSSSPLIDTGRMLNSIRYEVI